jgi:hypothetical protein
MNTTTQTPTFDSSSASFLEPEMANLLNMTNEIVMKIKQQTKEMYL